MESWRTSSQLLEKDITLTGFFFIVFKSFDPPLPLPVHEKCSLLRPSSHGLSFSQHLQVARQGAQGGTWKCPCHPHLYREGYIAAAAGRGLLYSPVSLSGQVTAPTQAAQASRPAEQESFLPHFEPCSWQGETC